MLHGVVEPATCMLNGVECCRIGAVEYCNIFSLQQFLLVPHLGFGFGFSTIPPTAVICKIEWHSVLGSGNIVLSVNHFSMWVAPNLASLSSFLAGCIAWVSA